MQFDLFEKPPQIFSPRYYQAAARDKILSAYKEGINPLLIMATGTGKTQVFSYVIDAIRKNSLVLAHRETLIDQAIQKVHTITGIRPHKEKAHTWASDNADIIVASVQSLQRERMKRFPHDYFSLITTDEAHHAVAKTYQNIYNYFDTATHLGVTATPDRSDKQKLGKIYDKIVYEYSLTQAINDGYLSRIKGYRVKDFTIDLSGLKIYAGDYGDGELGELIEKYIAPIAKSIVEQSAGLKTMIFMPTVESSRIMSNTLKGMDIDAGYIAGITENNNQILYDFHVGNISHLVSCNMLLEGYDEPSVEAIVMLRPTGSRSVFTQIVGRGTRIYPGKEYLKLIEFTYNSKNLKLVTPYELFASSEYTERIREKAALNELSDEIDFLQALNDSEKQFHDIKNIISRMVIKGHGFTEFDPLAVGDILNVDITGEFDLKYQGHKVEGRVTAKQVELLSRYGIKKFDEVDRAQASILIGKLFENGYKPFNGMATQRQIQFLSDHGIDATKMKKAQASMVIDQIKKREYAEQEKKISASLTF